MAKKPGNKAETTPAQRRKAVGELKQDLIQIRVTSEQRRTLREAADQSGLDLSSWLRMVGLRAASEKR
jgi:uncharacterized protein (DUF1778 family)